MGVKQTKLTDEQFNLLKTTDQWNIDEVPQDRWPKIPGIQRLHDTFSIMAAVPPRRVCSMDCPH